MERKIRVKKWLSVAEWHTIDDSLERVHREMGMGDYVRRRI